MLLRGSFTSMLQYLVLFVETYSIVNIQEHLWIGSNNANYEQKDKGHFVNDLYSQGLQKRFLQSSVVGTDCSMSLL